MNALAWISSLFVVLGLIGLGYKHESGWFLSIVGCVGWAVWAGLDGNDALMFVSAIEAIASCWGWSKWTDTEKGDGK